MRKKWKTVLTALVLSFGMLSVKEVSAQTVCVYDHADLLSDQEEKALQETADRLAETWDMNFLAVTTEDAEGKSAEAYADDYYDQRFPEESQEDGILYLIDMDNREIYLSTCGTAISYLTDSRIDAILEEAFQDVAQGAYYETFVTFFEETEEYLNKGIPGKETRRITTGEFIAAFAAALICAAAAMLGIKAKYQLKFEDFHYDAYTDSQIDLSVKSDRLINQFVTHRRIPKNNGGSGGGNRSSVHTSSTGRSHGGGGKKF